MTIDLRAIRAADGGVVWLSGELDAAMTSDLDAAMREPVRAGGTVLLDLTGLSFIDSDGIRALTSIAKRLQGSGCLVIHDPSPHVAKVFRIVRIADVPNLYVLDSKHRDIGTDNGTVASSRAAAFQHLVCDAGAGVARALAIGRRNDELRRRMAHHVRQLRSRRREHAAGRA